MVMIIAIKRAITIVLFATGCINQLYFNKTVDYYHKTVISPCFTGIVIIVIIIIIIIISSKEEEPLLHRKIIY